MTVHAKKHIGKSEKYKYVYIYRNSVGNIAYFGKVAKYKKQGFINERDCALWVDKILLDMNKEPINILVRK